MNPSVRIYPMRFSAYALATATALAVAAPLGAQTFCLTASTINCVTVSSVTYSNFVDLGNGTQVFDQRIQGRYTLPDYNIAGLWISVNTSATYPNTTAWTGGAGLTPATPTNTFDLMIPYYPVDIGYGQPNGWIFDGFELFQARTNLPWLKLERCSTFCYRVPVPVPEPWTAGLLMVGLLGLSVTRRAVRGGSEAATHVGGAL